MMIDGITTELLLTLGGVAAGSFIAGWLSAPSSKTSSAGVGAHPLPCFLFKPDMSRAEQVACLREMADELETRPAQQEGGDNA